MSDATISGEQGRDPLNAVADAMEAAVKGAKQGVSDAQAMAAEAVPAATKMVSNLVYKTCYGISYGVVFPSILLARSIPTDNAAVHGLIDGARAAMDMVHEMKGRSVGDSAAPHPAISGPGGEAETPGGHG
jgi:hypothetical protein